jgi:hypothetical protein
MEMRSIESAVPTQPPKKRVQIVDRSDFEKLIPGTDNGTYQELILRQKAYLHGLRSGTNGAAAHAHDDSYYHGSETFSPEASLT